MLHKFAWLLCLGDLGPHGYMKHLVKVRERFKRYIWRQRPRNQPSMLQFVLNQHTGMSASQSQCSGVGWDSPLTSSKQPHPSSAWRPMKKRKKLPTSRTDGPQPDNYRYKHFMFNRPQNIKRTLCTTERTNECLMSLLWGRLGVWRAMLTTHSRVEGDGRDEVDVLEATQTLSPGDVP